MTAKQVLAELEAMGSPSVKRMLMANHGVKEPCFGVKIGDMKKIQKRIKKDYELALALYDTGNYDAMYFAGLIADDVQMTKKDLRRWASNAYGGALCGATVAWVAAGSNHGWEMALEWIDSPKERVVACGWATLISLVAVKPDDKLDLGELQRLLQRVQKTIHESPDTVRYQMNGFVIAVGSFVKPLSELALTIGEKIGPVTADLGNNDCRVPFAPDYIRKVAAHGSLGKKKKTAKC
jgi:3-methyladenine DNA glycosylase AlkD